MLGLGLVMWVAVGIAQVLAVRTWARGPGARVVAVARMQPIAVAVVGAWSWPRRLAHQAAEVKIGSAAGLWVAWVAMVVLWPLELVATWVELRRVVRLMEADNLGTLRLAEVPAHQWRAAFDVPVRMHLHHQCPIPDSVQVACTPSQLAELEDHLGAAVIHRKPVWS